MDGCVSCRSRTATLYDCCYWILFVFIYLWCMFSQDAIRETNETNLANSSLKHRFLFVCKHMDVCLLSSVCSNNFPTLVLMETIFLSRFFRTEPWRHAHTRQSTVVRPWKHHRCHAQARVHCPAIPGCQFDCFPRPSWLSGAEAADATLPGWAGAQRHKSWCAFTHSQSHQVVRQRGDPATAQQAERRGVPDCLQHGVHGENGTQFE